MILVASRIYQTYCRAEEDCAPLNPKQEGEGRQLIIRE